MSSVFTLNGPLTKISSNKKKEKNEESDVAGPSSSKKVKAGAKLETSIVDPIWETLDPTPDVHALFLLYNDTFFQGALAGCEVRWSPRMTSCAGICSYEGLGGLCSIRLSKPLLMLRPRKDFVETLLHEMIHAYLFVTVRNRDRDAHGADFQLHMHRINSSAGTNITIYHTFFAEVANYKQHWWRCEGPCRSRRPFFGWVKRASNRAPGANDIWWAQHQQTCGGKFVKVKEPEGYQDGKKITSKKRKSDDDDDDVTNGEAKQTKKLHKDTKSPAVETAFPGKGFVLGGEPSLSSTVVGGASVKKKLPTKTKTPVYGSIEKFFPTEGVKNVRAIPERSPEIQVLPGPSTSGIQYSTTTSSITVDLGGNEKFVTCPVCTSEILETVINSHLDECLARCDAPGS